MTINTLNLNASYALGAGDGSATHNAERAAELAKEAVNTGIESGRQAIAEARNAIDTGVHIAQDKMGSAIDIAKAAAANVASSVSDAASYAGQKAEDATGSVGGALESTGHYLKEDGLRHIASDATELIRRNPMPAMLLGVGLGFLVALASGRRRA